MSCATNMFAIYCYQLIISSAYYFLRIFHTELLGKTRVGGSGISRVGPDRSCHWSTYAARAGD